MLERTQLMLDKNARTVLKKWSQKRNKSVSRVVRDILDAEIERSKGSKKPQKDPVKFFEGILKDATDFGISGDYDKYIYNH